MTKHGSEPRRKQGRLNDLDTVVWPGLCSWFLDSIVHGLALTRISPNVLTFMGLVINIGRRVPVWPRARRRPGAMFLYAGLVIIGAGIFDMVDGRVARATGKVTVFGGFFDSVIDRYSDVALFFGLLVYYARRQSVSLRGADGLCDGHLADGELHARARRSPDRVMQGRLYGAAGAHRPGDSGRAVQSHGAGALGDRRARQS